MEDCIGLEFPAIKPPNWVFLPDFKGINRYNPQGLEQVAHVPVQLGDAEVPEFDWQITAQLPQQIYAYPGRSEIAHSTAANNNSTAGKPVWVFLSYLSESIASQAGIVQVQGLLVIIVSQLR